MKAELVFLILYAFANARIVRWIAAKKAEGLKGNNTKDTIQVVILDMSSKWLGNYKHMQLTLKKIKFSVILYVSLIRTFGRFDQH